MALLSRAQFEIANRRQLATVFVDLAKAFDTVSHSKLWDVLGAELDLRDNLLEQLQMLYDGL